MRIYQRENKKYLSVTSILDLMFPFESAGFNKWAIDNGYNPEWIMKESGRIGTLVHAWCENRIHGIDWADEMPKTKVEKGYYNSVNSFFDDTGKILPGSKGEFEVYCDEFRFAGRCDSKINGCRLDYKTFGAWRGKYKEDASKIKKVKIQLSMYSYAENGRDRLDEEILAVLLLKPDGTYDKRLLGYTDEWKDWIRDNQELINKFLI